MNEFVEQFLVESREHIEQATTDLLALEKAPDDRERLDSAFRAFHTLKGSAGIVDFTAMADAVHAAEDVLSETRIGARAITPASIGDCLACLDQVIRWLDAMAVTGAIPPAATAEADVIVARFARATSVRPRTSPKRRSMPDSWADELRERVGGIGAHARTAIRYVPQADCFYAGEDPLARIAALPGLLAIDAGPASPWPPLDALDPFACNLVVMALTASHGSEVTASMADVMSHCDIQDLVDERPKGGREIPLQAREILQAQMELLAETGAHDPAGRMASAGVAATNVLRYLRRRADADHVARALEATLKDSDPRVLRAAIGLALNEAPPAVTTPAAPVEAPGSARTLRIDAARVDALVNLTGELIVAKNSIGHAVKMGQVNDSALTAILKDRFATLDHLVGELQRSVLGMRVLPLRQAFQRLPRLLREMSTDLGKPARLVVEGAETEADKAIVEMLFEPLLHVLRNAMDHGVEDAATRAARHKASVATIGLRAGRQGEHVVVEVSDDGAGIDVARIRQVALERGIVADELLAGMSDQDVVNMIFEPGFSTAREVTGLSGRGVGMDAVRTAVGRLGGQVGVESRAGQGTTVRFTLPFSVLMTRVMVVGAAGQFFGIALDAVVETLRVEADRIVPMGATFAVVLRNRTVPVLALSDALGLEQAERRAGEATLVVTNINGLHGALRVDRVGERIDVMLKPFDGLLAGMRGIAGSTLLGDGSVLLVLDLEELFQ